MNKKVIAGILIFVIVFLVNYKLKNKENKIEEPKKEEKVVEKEKSKETKEDISSATKMIIETCTKTTSVSAKQDYELSKLSGLEYSNTGDCLIDCGISNRFSSCTYEYDNKDDKTVLKFIEKNTNKEYICESKSMNVTCSIK